MSFKDKFIKLANSNFRCSKFYLGLVKLFTLSDKEKVLKKAFDFIKYSKIQGDYFEFGVYKGDSLIKADKIAKTRGMEIDYVVFDSFQGLPKLSKREVEYGNFREGDYSCSLEEFEKNVWPKIHPAKITVIKGFYKDSLNDSAREKIRTKCAIAMIDCDVYESTKQALDFLTDYIQDGTIIIFDDYFHYRGNDNFGERRAFKEWLSKNKQFRATEFMRMDWTGNSFLINIDDI